MNQGKEIKPLPYLGPERAGIPQQHHSSALAALPVGCTPLPLAPLGQVPSLGLGVTPGGCLVVCAPFPLVPVLPRALPAYPPGENTTTRHSKV